MRWEAVRLRARPQSARASHRCVTFQNKSVGLRVVPGVAPCGREFTVRLCQCSAPGVRVLRTRRRERARSVGADRYGQVLWRSGHEPGRLEAALLARGPPLAPALQGLLGLRAELQ